MDDIKNLPEPQDQSEVNHLPEGTPVEAHAGDDRIVVGSLKLPSVATGLSWLDQISVLAHEANRVWSMLHGDTSHATYVDAPDWQKASARAGVQGIADGTIKTPEEAHQSWTKQKLDDGWTYGAKDAEAKTHPCLVPYNALPAEQQAKDAIFFGIAQGLVAQHQRAHRRASALAQRGDAK